jgi:hypothetical protein
VSIARGYPGILITNYPPQVGDGDVAAPSRRKCTRDTEGARFLIDLHTVETLRSLVSLLSKTQHPVCRNRTTQSEPTL